MANGRRRTSATATPASIAAVALLLGGGALISSGTVRAQGAANPPHPVHIHSGTCDDLGEIVAPLNDVTPVGVGAVEGAAAAIPAELSVSEVELGLAAILGAPHAINVHESAENIGEYVACGDIGGRLVDGELVIGLQELGGSDLSGVAVLEADDEDETDITIYLVEEGVTVGAPTEGAAGAAAPPATEAAPAAPTAAPAADPTPAPAAEPTAAPAPAAEAAVSIRDFAYDPNPIEVAVGTTITWTNNDPVPHTATASGGDVLQSGLIPPDGGSFSQTFDAAGEFSYFCEFHPDMNGTIVVE